MNVRRIKTIFPPLLLCVLLLAACSRAEAGSATAESSSAVTVNGRVSEAYASLEDPLVRGRGPVTYWPPYYEQPEEAASNSASSVYAVTRVSLEPVTYGTQLLYKLDGSDYLISKPLEEDKTTKTAINSRAKELLTLEQQNPQVKFYTYFITRATNCDWYGTTEGIYAYDYASHFKNQLGSNSGITCGEFTLRNLQDYMDTGYRLDFHLNHIGAYRAYQDIYYMLAEDIDMTPVLVPVREVDYGDLRMIGQTIENPEQVDIQEENMDVFKTYQFDYGGFTSYVDDKEMTIGMEKEYSEGQFSRDPTFPHLFSFYGGQSGIVRFEFHQSDRPNLLMLSDSQGRPIRKLLASHFNRTVYLDAEQTNRLDLNEVIQEYDIDLVVLVGQYGMFERFNGG